MNTPICLDLCHLYNHRHLVEKTHEMILKFSTLFHEIKSNKKAHQKDFPFHLFLIRYGGYWNYLLNKICERVLLSSSFYLLFCLFIILWNFHCFINPEKWESTWGYFPWFHGN